MKEREEIQRTLEKKNKKQEEEKKERPRHLSYMILFSASHQLPFISYMPIFLFPSFSFLVHVDAYAHHHLT